VLTPLRSAIWQRDRESHAFVSGELIGDTESEPQCPSVLLTERLKHIRLSAEGVG
jgi:hypothetical protein